MDPHDTPELPSPPPPAAWPGGMDRDLIVVLVIGAAALLCTCLLYLGERRARAESEANGRAFRAAAILHAAQTDAASAHAPSGHATAHLEHASIRVVTIPCENTPVRGVLS